MNTTAVHGSYSRSNGGTTFTGKRAPWRVVITYSDGSAVASHTTTEAHAQELVARLSAY